RRGIRPIAELVDVKEAGAGDVRGKIFLAPAAAARRHVPAGIHDHEIGLAEVRRQPFGRNERVHGRKDRRARPVLLVGRAMDTRHLGQTSALPASPEEAVLDYVPNPRGGALYLVRFTAPEFTSLCPVTGQPDFAHLVIDYAPAATIVESKSLKLFLGSFRNHCAFHEDVTVGIGQRLM